MTDRELMQQALEALNHVNVQDRVQIITALRERLAQPEQEPFAYSYLGIKANGEQHGPHLTWKPEYMDAMSASMGAVAVPLYTTPPQRKPLTPREIELIDGMIEVQLNHAERCDSIPNRAMAEKQKGWDMERVELLRKLKEKNA